METERPYGLAARGLCNYLRHVCRSLEIGPEASCWDVDDRATAYVALDGRLPGYPDHDLALVWDEEMSAGDIAAGFDVTFGAVSQHLTVLREAGFVTVRKEGNRRLYRADKNQLGPFRAVLEAMWAGTLDRLAEAIETEAGRGDE